MISKIDKIITKPLPIINKKVTVKVNNQEKELITADKLVIIKGQIIDYYA